MLSFNIFFPPSKNIKTYNMKKRFFLMAIFSILLLGLQAQTVAITNKPTDIFFIGHTIRVFKMGAGYGYDISYQNRLLIHQLVNPVTGQPTGLKTQEDAIKLAKWQVIHFRHFAPVLTPEEKTIPKDVAKQLNIATN